jgi:hypothetical protein
MAKSRDPIKLARGIFDEFLEKHDADSVSPHPKKDSQAQEAGRKGGLIGGKVRALRLSVQERKEIAQKGGESRWSKKADSD